MKIAICFSGSIRDFPSCFPSLKRYFLDNFNADIFLHLWKMKNVSELNSNVDFKWKNDLCDEKYVIDCLKPVSYIIDEYSLDWENKIINESGIDISKFTDENLKNYGVNACGMYYKIMKCFELVEDYCHENDKKYDLVIRARFDFIWEDSILLNDFDEITDNKIYLIKDKYATHSRSKSNDKFFGGSFNVMKQMCNLFKNMKNYQQKNIRIEGQTLNEHHIRSLNLGIVWIGHENTYYKCMGRHTIKNKQIYIVISNNILFDGFYFELAYQLLYNGYNVIYFKNDTNKYTNILCLFRNFKFYDNSFDLNKISCFVGNSYNENIGVNQIIINSSSTLPDNATSINIGTNITTRELTDFIMSIIYTNKYGGKYNFQKKMLIEQIDIGEDLIIRYLDHGYYRGQLKGFNCASIKYTFNLNKDTIVLKREHVWIIDLLKYHSRIDPLCLPINLYKYNYPNVGA